MPVPKKLTIGVSVNLQRYENLRLVVEGEVATEEDAEDLALYLDRVLARFGRNDPETALQIDRYRQRVMPVSGAGGGPEPASAPASGPPSTAPGEGTPAVKPQAPASSAGPAGAPGYLSRREGGAQGGAASAPATISVAGAGPSASPGVSSPSAPPVSPVSAPAAPAAPPAGAKGVPPSPAVDDHVCCEACGVALSRQEAKLSRLFVDRLLCKKCLDSLQR